MRLSLIVCLLPITAYAQQVDPAKLGIALQQQRNSALDNLAACFVTANDLQVKIAELEKKLAEATQQKKDNHP